MKLTIKELNIIRDALNIRAENYKYYVDDKDDEGNPRWPDEIEKYHEVQAVINKIDKVEV